MNHVGISVANLSRSIAFYRDALRMELVSQEGLEGEQYDRLLALRGAIAQGALLRNGNLQIELFEFSSPHAALANPSRPVCDHGITHFCIDVTNIEQEYERLLAAGASFHAAPIDFGIAKVAYGRDPDGNVFELLEMREDHATRT